MLKRVSELGETAGQSPAPRMPDLVQCLSQAFGRHGFNN